MPFNFETLDVYKKSLQPVQNSYTISQSLKSKIPYSILDQLTRAGLSIPLNIAEGNGRWHKNEKRHFLWIARGSVFEMIPIFQILHRMKLLTDMDYAENYKLLEDISKMLSSMIKSFSSLETHYDGR